MTKYHGNNAGGASMRNVDMDEDFLDEYAREEEEFYLDDDELVDSDEIDAWRAAFNRGYKAA
jgi:hypothetical protein